MTTYSFQMEYDPINVVLIQRKEGWENEGIKRITVCERNRQMLDLIHLQFKNPNYKQMWGFIHMIF